ncbi:hypothetical protein M378DRAFT_17161 [Amanita muscaria Koide BX008]|uniref:Uncharacterized protein n=1 Tax=Amanita muscaria (strain Koide BX008) TaxID=946122 RepID=A0A0C2SQT4_AMAMK|nr:hypothetical protein M378DRAFT_17161 [Amanita muscaria Koide BX008]
MSHPESNSTIPSTNTLTNPSAESASGNPVDEFTDHDEDVILEVTRQCELILEQYRRGEITRTDATISLVTAIPGSAEPEAPGYDALVQFLASLEEDSASTRTASKRGQQGLTGAVGGPNGTSGEPASELAANAAQSSSQPKGQASHTVVLTLAHSPAGETSEPKRVKLDDSHLAQG